MKVKTSDLKGRALDWAVWATENDPRTIQPRKGYTLNIPKFSSDWGKCGEILDRFDVDISPHFPGYFASAKMGIRSFGDTRKIAICRAVVSAKLGDEVEIPDSLMEEI